MSLPKIQIELDTDGNVYFVEPRQQSLYWKNGYIVFTSQFLGPIVSNYQYPFLACEGSIASNLLAPAISNDNASKPCEFK